MIKILKTVLILAAICIAMVIPLNEAKAVNLGPFSVTVDFCKQTESVIQIVNAWSQAAFPVTGQPGFVIMTVETTNPLITVCDYIIQLSISDNTSAIFLTADKLNNITNQKWNDHLNFMKQTYSMVNSVYDLNSGKQRSGTVLSAGLAASFGTWQHQLTDLATGNNPQAIRERQDYDNQIAELANIAHQRAILKEGTNCPAPQTNAPNYNDIAAQIVNLQTTADSSKNDINFFKYQLIQLGPRFLNGVSSVKTYYNDVQNMMVLGVTVQVQETVKNVDTVTPTGASNADGTAVRQTEQIQQTVQTFSVTSDQTKFLDFKGKYQKQYQAWAKQFFDDNSGTPSGQKLIQDVFKPSLYECKESTLMAGFSNPSQDEYEREKADRFTKCQANNKMDSAKAIDLFRYYVDNLATSLQSNKTTQAQIWTIESQSLGQRRSVSTENAGDYFQEDVVCQQTPEMVDFANIQAKEAQVNAQYNEIIAREAMKSGMVRDEELRKQQEQTEEVRAKRMQIEKDKQSEETAVSTPGAMGSPKDIQ